MKMLGYSFHFRGKTRSLLAISRCFQDHPGKGLHPTEISRFTGYNFIDINTCLKDTPELFIKLPRRDKGGVNRYRLATTISNNTPDELEKFIREGAKKESMTFYTVVGIVVSLFTLALMLSFPLSSWL